MGERVRGAIPEFLKNLVKFDNDIVYLFAHFGLVWQSCGVEWTGGLGGLRGKKP